VAIIYRVTILSTILLAGMGFTIPANAGVSNVQVVNGTCSSSSNTAEGPLGSDLAKRESRFYCDTAAITFFDDYEGHVMIDFSQKESHHSPILGFAGRIETRPLEDGGRMMQVYNVYLGTGEATTVSDGSCKLFFKSQQLSGIGCGMKVDDTGRRTVATVTFDVTPGQAFQFKTNPDGSISNPPSSNLPLSKHLMGVDGLAGGSQDDIWQKVQSDGREIYVMTNGRYFNTYPPLSTAEDHSGYGFATYIVANLPESTIVGAPQSVMNSVEGNCQTRHYSELGSLFFADRNRSGLPMQKVPAENVERKLVPNSPFEKAFDMLCKIATMQK
jgi:hypothetical protein